jgi:hypothetical protein
VNQDRYNGMLTCIVFRNFTARSSYMYIWYHPLVFVYIVLEIREKFRSDLRSARETARNSEHYYIPENGILILRQYFFSAFVSTICHKHTQNSLVWLQQSALILLQQSV